MHPFTLTDPAGKTRATWETRPTVEQMLAVAWSLGPRDSIDVFGHGDSDWGLSVYRPDAAVKVQTMAVCGTMDRDVLLTLAWAELVDDGWRLDDATAPEPTDPLRGL